MVDHQTGHLIQIKDNDEITITAYQHNILKHNCNGQVTSFFLLHILIYMKYDYNLQQK